MRSLRILITAVVLSASLVSQTEIANAWQVDSSTTDFGDKQFILGTFFVSGKGAVPSKRPAGPHKELGIACTAGFFEIGFFDHAVTGHLVTIGSPTSIRVKFDGKLDPASVAVNTKKGTDYVQVNNSTALFKKLKAAKTFAVEMALSTGYYRATFDVKDLNKYVSNLAGAGCKL